MRAQTILFLLVDGVNGKLNCRPYRDGGEGNPKRLVEAASLAVSNRSNILTIRGILYPSFRWKADAGSHEPEHSVRLHSALFCYAERQACPTSHRLRFSARYQFPITN